jgi:hypothetical protein
VRNSGQDAEVTALLRTFDLTVAKLFRLGVNPYKRCVCPWSEPHSIFCPLGQQTCEPHRPHMQSRPQDCNLRQAPVCMIPDCGCIGEAHP